MSMLITPFSPGLVKHDCTTNLNSAKSFVLGQCQDGNAEKQGVLVAPAAEACVVIQDLKSVV